MSPQAKNSLMTLDKPLHEYLPAVHQTSPALIDLLRAFGEHFKTIDTLLSETDQKVNPDYASVDNLRWLASWVGLDLEEDWDERKSRKLIKEAVELYRLRGTTRGLRRYLEIYTGLDPKIKEFRGPGGFQIGVASRIGGFKKLGAKEWTDEIPGVLELVDAEGARDDEAADYYIITRHKDGQPTHPTVIYLADKVRKVEIPASGVSQTDNTFTIIMHTAEGATDEYRNAHIVRRDDLPGPRTLHDRSTPCTKYEYYGDTILLDEVEVPYSFDVELTGPSLQGVVNQLAAERQRLTEALFAGQSTKSERDKILDYLTDDARNLISDIVTGDLSRQAIGHFAAPQPDDTRLADEIKEQLEFSLRSGGKRDGLCRSIVGQRDQIARGYIQEVRTRWLESDEDGQERLRQQLEEFVEICRIHLAEILLRTLVRSREEKDSEKIKRYSTATAEIERYLTPTTSGQDEPEAIRRVRAVLDREKPAHTCYSLRFRDEKPPAPPGMQIGVHSMIGASTVIGDEYQKEST